MGNKYRNKAAEETWEVGSHPAIPGTFIVKPVLFGSNIRVLPACEGGHVSLKNPDHAHLIRSAPALYRACAEFVRKVECGEARSTRSYRQMKAALAEADGKVTDG